VESEQAVAQVRWARWVRGDPWSAAEWAAWRQTHAEEAKRAAKRAAGLAAEPAAGPAAEQVPAAEPAAKPAAEDAAEQVPAAEDAATLRVTDDEARSTWALPDEEMSALDYMLLRG